MSEGQNILLSTENHLPQEYLVTRETNALEEVHAVLAQFDPYVRKETLPRMTVHLGFFPSLWIFPNF